MKRISRYRVPLLSLAVLAAAALALWRVLQTPGIDIVKHAAVFARMPPHNVVGDSHPWLSDHELLVKHYTPDGDMDGFGAFDIRGGRVSTLTALTATWRRQSAPARSWDEPPAISPDHRWLLARIPDPSPSRVIPMDPQIVWGIRDGSTRAVRVAPGFTDPVWTSDSRRLVTWGVTGIHISDIEEPNAPPREIATQESPVVAGLVFDHMASCSAGDILMLSGTDAATSTPWTAFVDLTSRPARMDAVCRAVEGTDLPIPRRGDIHASVHSVAGPPSALARWWQGRFGGANGSTDEATETRTIVVSRPDGSHSRCLGYVTGPSPSDEVAFMNYDDSAVCVECNGTLY